MRVMQCSFFFFNDPAPTEIYTLSLHDALPIFRGRKLWRPSGARYVTMFWKAPLKPIATSADPETTGSSDGARSEEHTSELQSQSNLVCRLLLEKKKKIKMRKSCATT